VIDGADTPTDTDDDVDVDVATSDEALVIVTELADDDPWGDTSDDPTQAMPIIGTDRDAARDTARGDDDFRFSFDDDRN
jgi:hypothetical protein